MKLVTPYLFLLFIGMLACNNPSTETTTKAPVTTEKKAEGVQLKKLWTSEDGFVTPEAIIYDEARNVFYVANINENPWEEDKNGFISKMDDQGKIIELKWVTNDLSGPKGMAIDGDKLMVADINQLLTIHIPTGSVMGSIRVNNGTNLNDITLDDHGVAYVSASNSKMVYRKVENDFKPMLSGLDFSPNGVLFNNGQLYVLGFDSEKMYSVNMTTNSTEEFTANIGSADGLEADGKGGFISSSWKGAIYHINAKGESTKLIDTSADGKGAADIEYVAKTQTLYVPTFFDNHVEAYKVEFN